MAESVSVGVIGVGHLGAHHVRLLHASPLWRLSGVFDIDPQKNAAIAGQYRLPVCASVEELIDRCRAIVICTPTQSHAVLARQSLAAGCHVLVEKPLCASADEADMLTDQAGRAGVVGAVGHVERFNSAITAVREQITRPRFIEAHRLNQFSPRGLATDVVLEMMIHDIDLARWLVGTEPVEIRAAGVPVLSDTDDIANCRLAFADGCVANLTASRISSTPMRKMRIFSVDQYTTIDLSEKSAESYRLSRAEVALPPGYRHVASWQAKSIARCSFAVADVNALADELSDFHTAIVGQRPPRVDFAEAARSLRVALAVAQACRQTARLVPPASTPSIDPVTIS